MTSNHAVLPLQTKLIFAGLLIFSAVFLISGIGNVQLVDWDENIYGEASRQMLLRGDYLNVYINNHLFAEKPPFFFWEQVLSYKLFGIGEFGARLPSALAGIVTMALLFHVGRRAVSSRMGLIWGLVYLTSFLPSVLGRVAVIDHTFNLLIGGATFFLWLFDLNFHRYLEAATGAGVEHRKRKRSYLSYLIAASICMGIANLTKGPLGGVIPLVAFGGYKLYRRQPGIRLAHFLLCGVISLAIAFSWYFANWLSTGGNFLSDFIEFQLLLLSKPMEGHQGLLYYHFVVGLLGLLPWTAFLFMGRLDNPEAAIRYYKSLMVLGITWIGFVLIVFSIVSTKLPHYSASIYLPLSMIVALNLEFLIASGKAVPIGNKGVLLLCGLGFSLLFFSMPLFLEEYAKIQMVAFPTPNRLATYILACLIGICFLSAFFFFHRQRIAAGIVMVALAMLVFTQGLWRYQLPVFIQIHQQPLLQLVQEAHATGNRLALYRMVSFAAFFYGKQPIEILHNYKFPGDAELLNRQHENDTYVICDIAQCDRLRKDHPLVKPVKQSGRFFLYKIAGAHPDN